ncbi:MAG: hypothetical protein RBU45_07945, partial [Myxococcota bacterium]|nr:hypothetical protein [Myxococcota bacterium]
MTRHPLLLLLPLLLALSGCDAPTLGPDEDGDGLTAAQEERFGTDPRRPDTDGDGLLDGADPSPTPGLPALTLELLAVREEQASWAAELQAVVRDHLGAALEVEELAGTSSLGQLAPFVRTARTGVWTSRLVSAERGLAEVRACLPAAQGGGCSHPLQVSLCPGLPQPGLNPGAGVQGAFNGSLQVFALDGRTVGSPDRSPDPVPGAYVQLRLADGSLLEGQTDSCGSLVLRDRRLAGEPVTVTVASPGRRYVTFCDVRARIVAADLHPLDPIAGQGGTGAVAGVITGFLGEHVPPFPPTDNPLEELNVAIVHAAFRNEKLSSLSISNVLEMPDAQSSLAGMPIPSNMVVYSSGAEAPFTLPNLPPGEHLIFALAGRGKGVLETLEDPYMHRFTHLALGVATVTVEAGVTRGGVEIPLTVDLGPTSSE